MCCRKVPDPRPSRGTLSFSFVVVTTTLVLREGFEPTLGLKAATYQLRFSCLSDMDGTSG